MPDQEDDGFNEETFKGFGEDPAPVTPPVADPVAPPVEPPKVEEPKPTDPQSKEEIIPVEPAPVDDAAKPPETPGVAPVTETPETPQPLTKDDVASVITDLLSKERTSGKELDITTQEVLEAYYPDGLSNVLVDERTNKELRTPQDVVDASNGEMSMEDAAQWLMNKQHEIDQNVAKIKDDARSIAETTVNFKRDSITAIEKYEPLFKAYPTVQKEVFDLLMKQVKVDKDRGVVLSAPDVLDLYDSYLKPYQMAYEFSTKQPATAPTTPTTPEPPKPSAEDRMDESGDGSGGGEVNDPTDFAQQVKKELSKGI